jgi:hypothetical protein
MTNPLLYDVHFGVVVHRGWRCFVFVAPPFFANQHITGFFPVAAGGAAKESPEAENIFLKQLFIMCSSDCAGRNRNAAGPPALAAPIHCF